MKTWQEFIDEIDEGGFITIIADYEECKKNGCIDDCMLRGKAQEWSANVGHHGLEVIFMKDIAFEAYKHFAQRYIQQNNIMV